MGKHQNRDLSKRIAKLVKQNKELHHQLWQLTGNNLELAEQVDKYREKLGQLDSGDGISATKCEPENILRVKTGTVLYTEITGFSRLTEQMDTQSMMDDLDSLFFRFDQIVNKYKLEKIKTIGDSYMCAGGIPVKNSTNPVDVAMAALEMHHYLEDLKKRSLSNRIWDIRIGIHTGPLTAIASGKRKLSWEIKGDTVNIASRLCSSCAAGKVNISANTYEFVKEFFICEYNNRIPVKYLGKLPMYYVVGIVPEISQGGYGILPNEKFDVKFKLVQFNDLQEIILDRLEKELPAHLLYHNVKHTIDVVTEVELLGWAEGVDELEILLLKTAALFHDAGHIKGYDDHEYFGCQLAREYLPRYDFSPGQTDQVCKLIMATKMPPEPQNLLEKIICDSDLDYLGRSDFIPVSDSLYEELRLQNKIGSLAEWNRLQIKFISKHQYFTETAQNLREVNKQKQIERIKGIITEE